MTTLEQRALLKLDLFVVPIVTMFYFLSFLDRSNVGNSRVAGMQKDLRISDHQYQVAITVTYVSYIASEFPCTLLLKRVGPNIMLPCMATSWGLVTTLQGVVYNYNGLVACRFFLGLFEGGLLPGLILYLSYFYPRRKLQFRVSILFVATSLAGAFSGLLAAAIVNMDGLGNRRGWQWIFILEGIFTVLFGVFSFFVFPKSPSTCIFLNQEEKQALKFLLEKDGVSEEEKDKNQNNNKIVWKDVLSAFYAPQVILISIAFFGNGVTLFGLAYFLPTVVSGLGYTGQVKVQLMTVPPYAVSAVVSLVFAVISDVYGLRGFVSIFSGILATCGYAMFLGTTKNTVLYGAVILQVCGAYMSAPALSTWNPNNVQPYFRKASAVAIGFIMTNSGGILSTWIFPTSQKPRYHTGTIINLVMSIIIIAASGLNVAYLYSRNKKRDEMILNNKPTKLADANADDDTQVQGSPKDSSDSSEKEDFEQLDDRDVRYRYTL